MDLIDLGDVGSGCEEKNCGLTSSFQEDCSNNDCHWEEPMFGLIELVCVTVIYIPLMLFGLLGNILTILVVLLRPHMRSSTYLYLSSMAVSDLLILLLLPLDLFKLWKPRPWTLGDLTCKLTMFLSECCTFCTILHITFLSLERYLAVCWPITAKTLVTRRRTRTVIGCLWLGAAVSAAPVLVMVGVEEVGGEELGFSQWREDRGWTGSKGEQGGFRIGGGERGSGHMALKDGGIQEIMLGERETKGWGERVGDLKWFSNDGEDKLRIGDFNERKQGDGGEMTDKIRADEEGGEEEGKVELEEEKPNKKKEDEGGGREGRVDGGLGREIDKRECRCTDYAVSSGLLSAMMILSNLYFLVPLCILGLMYSLIGRTLWLRPKSSRRDQSHRHTVKMLGVIVLAFVLCWLPFHVGRTIFSLSLGTGTDKQETHTDTNSDINTLSDISRDSNDINTHAVTKSFGHMDTHFSEAHSQTGEMNEHTLTERDEIYCEICGKTKVKINTHTDDMDTDTQSFPAISNTGTGPHDLDPSIKTNTHMETHNDSAHDNTLLRRFADDKIQNRTPICKNSQNNQTNHTQPTAGTNTYAAPPTDLYNDNTHNHARFNYTKSHPDTHLYFLYYLSQYFNLVSSVLFYLSAAVNPLLYNLMSARYRHAVHSLLHTHSHTQAYRLRTLTTQQSTTTL